MFSWFHPFPGLLAWDSFHLSIIFWSWFLSSICAHFRKLFLDFRRTIGEIIPNVGCSLSIFCFVFSQSALTPRRISGGAIPAKGKIFSSGILFKQPVIRRHDSFSAKLTCFACVNLLKAGLTYSPTEKYSDKAQTLRVWESIRVNTPGWFYYFPNQRISCLLFFCLVFSQCRLNVNERSSVTPMYLKKVVCSSYFPCYVMLSFWFACLLRRWKAHIWVGFEMVFLVVI